ncbi:4-amino-4-deoxy-L-arabinose transferase [Pimelobacter simplex]|uniref:4-amino-4-deoxy-L-arabinose transferase n=1 Tax=Nocardioides simplex TaxID=2045 RepID=A0A7J5DRE4_NOCSI|nr:4-amino-4-deoxy-L-arabinose transferase [Pimelobacter simplex]KAB2807416.1 4-amino-4-deoxy-L-arabinose transferase [Pimelobacter simplex]
MVSPSEVLELTLSRPPSLGTGRLICIDGLAGSGKTTLARALAALAPEAVVIGTDEMLEGWRGLPGLAASTEALLRPLAAGRPGTWRRWDWYADGWAETRTVAPPPLVILEGVGSAATSYRDLVTVLVWVEAPLDVRLARWLERDGEDARPHWDDWLADEAALHAREDTRSWADVVVRT